MNKLYLLVLLGFLGCDNGLQTTIFDGIVDRFGPAMIKDNTVYIGGMLEASPDTTHFRPQIWVGRASDKRDRKYYLYDDPSQSPLVGTIESPMLYAQLLVTAGNAHFSLKADNEAFVQIQGPIGHPSEKKVTLSLLKHGLYEDIGGELLMLPRSKYMLWVTLKDKRAYTAEMSTPELPYVNIPPRYDIKLNIVKYPNNGGLSERHLEPPPKYAPRVEDEIDYRPAPDAAYTIIQFNPEDCAEVASNANITTSSKSNRLSRYIGTCGFYHLKDNMDFGKFSRVHYTWSTSPSINKYYRTKMKTWIRISQVHESMRRGFESEVNWTFIDAMESNERRIRERSNATTNRDPLYWPSISNIYKLDATGAVLPKSKSDAIGFFGGYSSRYAFTVMYPIRDWNPLDYGWLGPLDN
ncbi:MAG TPA: hypothetical protein PLL64_02970 [Rhodothermales bacterium]|nr:hypothetical protein [Rhodothermales bacterium]HRR07555.1 hypothetical protein [Rhodothermales bacterium]